MFVPLKSFKLDLIFVDKTCRLWPYSQILDKDGNAFQVKTLKLMLSLRRWKRKYKLECFMLASFLASIIRQAKVQLKFRLLALPKILD